MEIEDSTGEDLRSQKSNQIINSIISGAKQSNDLYFFHDKELLADLVIKLDKEAEKHPLLNSALIALAQHVFMTSRIAQNLGEATELCIKYGIEFDSMIDVEDDDE